MLQTVGEAFGAPHREVRASGRDLRRDREQLSLQVGSEAAASAPHERVEPANGLVEPPQSTGKLRLALPVLREDDDLTHAATIARQADTALTCGDC
jgi:hypothetical protein